MFDSMAASISGPKMCEMCLLNFHDPKVATVASLHFGSVPADLLEAKQKLQFVPYPVAAWLLLQVCIISVGKAVTT